MAARNSERWLNLTMLLLNAGQPLARRRIRALVPGYQDLTETSFQRTFERDKAALRDMGIPLETVAGPSPEDEGYRILVQDFRLAPVDLTAEEAAAVTLAARTWSEAGLGSASQLALIKLRALGVHADAGALAEFSAPAAVAETRAQHVRTLPALRDAIAARRAVSFDYGERGTRHLDPWGLAVSRGQWYVFGADHDRDMQVRRFKLARITGEVRTHRGQPFDAPDPERVEAITADLDHRSADHRATLAIRPERLPALRHDWTPLEGPDGPRTSQGYHAISVAYGHRRGFVGELAALGTDVVVLDPPGLREELLAHLQAMLDAPAASRTPSEDAEEVPHGERR